MTLDLIYDTNTLVGVIENYKTASTFLLDNFFPKEVVAESKYITVDIDVGLRRAAPFVSPLSEARQFEGRRIQSNSYQAAYIKEKRALDLFRPVYRMYGEKIGGAETAEERAMQNVAFELTDSIDTINRTMEIMAAQALVYGSLTIASDDYPTTTVSFGRSSNLSVTLSGTNTWDYGAGSTADPVSNLQDWAYQVQMESGIFPTDVILSPTAWNCLRKNQEFLNAFSFPAVSFAKGGYDYRNAANVVDFGIRGGKGGKLLGNYGTFTMWLYQDWYVNSSGVETSIIPDGMLVMTAPEMSGVRAYTPILDRAFGYAPLKYAPKLWDEKDPAQTFLMVQSAPLVFPGLANASLAATVATGVLA